jgi:hypothetical protein
MSGSCSGRTLALSPPEALVTGAHIFTFSQIAETEVWRREYLARLAPVSGALRTGRRVVDGHLHGLVDLGGRQQDHRLVAVDRP